MYPCQGTAAGTSHGGSVRAGPGSQGHQTTPARSRAVGGTEAASVPAPGIGTSLGDGPDRRVTGRMYCCRGHSLAGGQRQESQQLLEDAVSEVNLSADRQTWCS